MPARRAVPAGSRGRAPGGCAAGQLTRLLVGGPTLDAACLGEEHRQDGPVAAIGAARLAQDGDGVVWLAVVNEPGA
jgi:hypothetical protein